MARGGCALPPAGEEKEKDGGSGAEEGDEEAADFEGPRVPLAFEPSP